MIIDRKKFYDQQHFRKFFHKTLSQPQVDGYEAIFDYWESKGLSDLRWLAYILATAYHETGSLMEPVREGFCKTDACSIAAVRSIGGNYAEPHPVTGKSYFGRGLVQLTHADNYKRMGDKLGIDLFRNPDLALDLKISVKILVEGMIDGEFTDKKLANFFNSSTEDWVMARDIVNPGNKRALVGEYGKDFFACLNKFTTSPVNNNLLDVPFLSQHDNAIDPLGTCNVTCLAMVLLYYGLDRAVRNNEQLEDRLEREMRNKGLDRHVHDHLATTLKAHGVNDKFTTVSTWEAVKQHLSEGEPVIVAGDFTWFGHILVVTGYNDTGFIVNDPNGKFLGERGKYDKNTVAPPDNEKGRGLVYSYSIMNRFAGPDGNVWAHFPRKV